jgi:alcohol dehydrogenase YqhD (iron-dependent ADH family)
MPVHQLEHVVSALYPEVAHAAGLAVIWPSYAMYYLDYDLDKFDRLSRNVFHSFKEDKRENALHAIECMKTYFNKLNMPKTFKDLGIENPDIDKLVEIFSKGGTRKVDHHSQPLDKNVAYEIFKACI